MGVEALPQLITLSFDKTIELRGFYTGRHMRTFTSHHGSVLSAAITPDFTWLISGDKNDDICFWDPSTGIRHLVIDCLGVPEGSVTVIRACRPNIFATVAIDNSVRIWQYVSTILIRGIV
ncbi:WD40 repeat domain-containing protein [Aspergillus ibericus CBS 121593]|uniref:Uncharacterized protein n=1 Tax=Aspergillus ibericus CBS 121593 TaxID=1448316 RepID=A0A395GPP6_9EURO|nr:hypothetical protein BO80DRAFT_437894 [Aspergillus ibericus CBS 121593]RAK97326.1 hypothetical protein BO80DRAFT_437894 [Aspergillus ibericus CBS 121593]